MINFGSAGAALSRGGHRDSDHRRQFRRRLDAVDPLPRPGRRRMRRAPATASVAATISIVLDVRGMRVAVRTDLGDGPVLVDDVSLQLQARRGHRPHRRIGRRQIDDRPRLDGLHPPRLPHRRRRHHLRRRGHPHDRPGRAARAARAENRLHRPERRRVVQSRPYADGAGVRSLGSPRRAEPRGSARRGGQPCSRSSICRAPRRSAAAIRTRSRADNCSASWRRWRWSRSPTSSSSTSRRPRSTSPPRSNASPPFASSSASTARRRSTSPTISRSSRRSPTGSWCSGAARWSSSATPGRSCRSRRRNTRAAWSANGSPAMASSRPAAAPRRRFSPSTTSPPTIPASPRSSTTSASRFAAATRSPWSGNRARANRRWRGS